MGTEPISPLANDFKNNVCHISHMFSYFVHAMDMCKKMYSLYAYCMAF